MADVRIGLVGSGYMALTYAEAIAKYVKGARLGAIAGGRRAPVLAAEYGVEAVPEVESLIRRSDIDAVVLATPDQFHHEETLQAAAAHKHVLVEKPMAPAVAQCNEMIAACQSAGVNLAVVKTERYRDLTLRVKKLIEEDAIGQVSMLRTGSFFPDTVRKELLSSRLWYADPRSGGLFLSMASHNADFLLWLIGSAAKRVYAQMQTYSAIDLPRMSTMANIAFENGVMADMWISTEIPAPGFPESEFCFQIVGRKGIIDFDAYTHLDLGAEGQWKRDFTPPQFDYLKNPKSPVRLEPHVRVVQEFVSSVQENRPPEVGGEAGRAAVEICEACVISARTGNSVTLPLS